MKKCIKFFIGLVTICSFASCSYFFETPTSSNGQSNPSEVLENDTKKEVVTINTGTSSSHSSLIEVIDEVRQTVVDINAYNQSFSSSGSGVIVGKSDEGYYVITNHHVIDQATDFEAVVYSSEDVNKTYKAYLIGTSKENDIAVLKVTTNDQLQMVSFIDDSTKVKVGTEVFAIGNPLGILGGSVTHGIVSAVQREVYLKELGYMDLIQTDAALNSGSSGGALFNNEGLLIGIVNSGFDGYQGLNFAIPANVARACLTSIVDTYKDNGNNYGYYKGETNIGISINIATVYTSANSNSQIDVVYASSIINGSDAAKYGISDYASYLAGKSSYFYCLEKINGVSITSLKEATKQLEDVRAGETLVLTCRKIQVSRQFLSTQYYLSGESFEVNISTSQYIYSL